MSEISLNASMRNNLLSLQQISKLQDRTQLRLSTGLKVNSAIDNPSSYYTACALNNRADDLSALLDAMGQGIQTIKAANEGIEKATDLVNQMKAIVEQVNTSGTYVPEKEYFINEVGSNGAVVSSAEELRDAINSGKETICVYGKIDLGNISSGGLQLQENQKLVGVNYFGNYKDGESFSSISATASVANKNLIDITQADCLISDLNLNYENTVISGEAYAVKVSNSNACADFSNITINAKFSEDTSNSASRGAIAIFHSSDINIKNNIDINVSGQRGNGIYIYNLATLNILSQSNVNIEVSGQLSYGIYCNNQANTFISNETLVNIKTSGQSGNGIVLNNQSNVQIAGNMQINTSNGYGIYLTNKAENILTMLSSSKMYFKTSSTEIHNNSNTENKENTVNITQGAKLAFEKNGKIEKYEVKENYFDKNSSSSNNHIITANNVETTLNVAQTSSWKTPTDIIEEQQQEAEQKAEEEKKNYETYQKQFNSALFQYDSLIKDSTYKGNNLLLADTLKVNFNEDKSAHLLVHGVDVSSENIGLQTTTWESDKDVSSTLSQVLFAKDKLRSAATKLGNYYSIITERETFTNNLINVLTEGANKLTLADMNEESANMLALQTQQQLAINSLSLASQASQAVLKLF